MTKTLALPETVAPFNTVPLARSSGFWRIVYVGVVPPPPEFAETVAVAVAVAVPPVPLQLRANAVDTLSGPTAREPAVGREPDQPPEALQAEALLLLQ
ncbi:MAG: hypothetical protein FJ197_10970, partial [Gammaproteobacteria bacterium]|nr:hypothetical protein [Gammaproteobacteria bacterium]